MSINMRCNFLFLALLFSLASTANASNQLADEFASTGFYPTTKDCKLPSSCSGTPVIHSTKKIRETSNDIVVDQRTLHFDGLEIELWYVLESPLGTKIKNPYKQPVILSLRITKPRWSVANDLHVGSPQKLVTKSLGAGQSHGRCTIYVNETKQDEVTFCFNKGVVQSIKWVPWNDA